MRLLRRIAFLEAQTKKALNYETFDYAKNIPQSY